VDRVLRAQGAAGRSKARNWAAGETTGKPGENQGKMEVLMGKPWENHGKMVISHDFSKENMITYGRCSRFRADV